MRSPGCCFCCRFFFLRSFGRGEKPQAKEGGPEGFELLDFLGGEISTHPGARFCALKGLQGVKPIHQITRPKKQLLSKIFPNVIRRQQD